MPDLLRRSRRTRGPRALAAGCAAVVAVLVPAGGAQAGEYHVYGCRLPSGAPAPIDGWSGSISGSYEYDSDSCATGGSMEASLDGGVDQPAVAAQATWGFSSPPGTAIAAGALWRSGHASVRAPNATTLVWLAAPTDAYDAADVFEQCLAAICPGLGGGAGLGPVNMVGIPTANLNVAHHVYVNASCGGAGGAVCPANGKPAGLTTMAWAQIYGSDIVLRQDSNPLVSAVGGALADAPVLTGSAGVSLSASDAGSGVYQLVFQVDGQTVSAVVPDANDGRCVDVGGASDGLHAFLYTQPCKSALQISAALDSGAIANGVHELKVLVTDAAGNASTAIDRQVEFRNAPGGASPAGAPGGGGGGLVSALASRPLARGAANGDNASDAATLSARWVRTPRPLLTVRYGQPSSLAGRLLAPDGRGITNATVEVLSSPAYPGAPTVADGTARTGPDGGWTLTLGPGVSSRSLSVRYQSHAGDTAPAATAALRLAVRAGLTLHITPHVASVGQRIVFRGVLHGGPIPSGGKQLVLEARQPGSRWIKFNVIRSRSDGSYSAAYRFRYPGPVTYQFRVLSKYEVAFPFVAGGSPVVTFRER